MPKFQRGWIEHLWWLDKMAEGDDPSISKGLLNLSKDLFWDVLVASDFRIGPPAACTGPDDDLMFYAWDTERYHLEVEIREGQEDEWFFADRESETFWGEDVARSDGIPQKVLDVLDLFL